MRAGQRQDEQLAEAEIIASDGKDDTERAKTTSA
jgi:hypothetical protein